MNICPTNSTISTSTSITNAKFTQLSDFARRMGIESETVHSVIKSGGGGIIPAMDLVRDATLAADSLYKYRTSPSTGNKLALIGRVTEVAYDVSETTPLIAKYFQILSPGSIETISYCALIARIIGQSILLPSCIDEATTSFGGKSRLGNKNSAQDMTFRKQTVSVLTFLEATTSTISNGALLLGGPDNSIHLTVSAATNSIKVLFLFLPHIFVITTVFEKILTNQKNTFTTPHPIKIKPKNLSTKENKALGSIVKKCIKNTTEERNLTLSLNISPKGVTITNLQVTPTKPTHTFKRITTSPIAKAALNHHLDRHVTNGATPITKTPPKKRTNTPVQRLFSSSKKSTDEKTPILSPKNDT